MLLVVVKLPECIQLHSEFMYLCPMPPPQELCTLLRAAHLPIATPLPFLTKLMDVLQNMPWITR